VSSTADDFGGTGAESGQAWPPNFPHLHIDGLITRLQEAGSLDSDDAGELLSLVAVEAQRLRTTVARLSADRLSAAEREASEIVADAHERAQAVRHLAMSILVRRLDDAEALMTALRHTYPTTSGAPGPRPTPRSA